MVCPSCGTGHIAPEPPEPTSLYTRDYFVQGGALAGYLDYEADAFWHHVTARQRLRRLDHAVRRRPQQPHLVDVGAATGFFLDVARSHGWRADGVEASHWAAARARQRGHRVEPTLASFTDDAEATAVTFFQSLEHFPDPVAALQEAARLLAPGGVVVCETWDAHSLTARLAGNHWQQLSPPSVLWLFTRRGMEQMAGQAGLGLETWRRSPKAVSLSTVLGQSVAASNHGLAARVSRAAGRAVAIPYVLDDLVTVVLRKPAAAPDDTK